MDKTATQRQQRYREQITKGEKKRLQVVLDREEADKLINICAAEGISKTEFIKRAISQHQKHNTNSAQNR
ncbi:ribbon-helix-helix domain-containing protein [Sessilibacter sp. MAH4]